MDTRLENRVRQHRRAEKLSQKALADLLGVSRQAIHAIESGTQVPSTSLGLSMARVFGCGVEDIFSLAADPGIRAHLAPAAPGCGASSRVALGRVDGRWIAHRIRAHGMTAAEGILVGKIDGDQSDVMPLTDVRHLERNVLVAGCAPLLGAVAHRVGRRFNDSRITWLRAGNARALELLTSRMVHVAGLHLSDKHGNGDTAATARQALPGQRLLVVNLTRWRQGVVVAAGNPLGIESGSDLLRPGLRVAQREAGSGASALAARIADADGTELPSHGPAAMGHGDVARLVGTGSADAGITIESAALAEGLDFVPLVEERFDLVVPAELAAKRHVSRLIETLDDPGFRTEVSHLPGYDGSLSGQVTTVEAA